jgi:hypothetical protein
MNQQQLIAEAPSSVMQLGGQISAETAPCGNDESNAKSASAGNDDAP